MLEKTLTTQQFSNAASFGIAVDSTSVYWSVFFGGGSGALYKVPIGGGTITALASANQPVDIVVDNTYVYWFESNGGPYDTTGVRKVPISGGPIATLATKGFEKGGLAFDGTYLYYAYDTFNIDGKVHIGKIHKNTDQQDPIDLVLITEDSPQDIAVDGTSVYWTDARGGTLRSAPKDGGTPTTLASGLNQPSGIVVDVNHVYWTESAGGVAGAGTVNKIPITGGVVTTIAGGLNNPVDITGDDTSIYWTELGTNGTDGVVKAMRK